MPRGAAMLAGPLLALGMGILFTALAAGAPQGDALWPIGLGVQALLLVVFWWMYRQNAAPPGPVR